MKHTSSFLVVLAILCTFSVLSDAHILTTKQLQKAMYKRDFYADFCVLLLDRGGQVGCRGPGAGHGVLDLPLVGYGVPHSFRSAVFVSPSSLADLLDDVAAGRLTPGAIVLDTDGQVYNASQPIWSPAPRFPHQELSPYGAAGGYAWNPAGRGAARAPIPCPMVVLSPPKLPTARGYAALNNKLVKESQPTLYNVKIDHQMLAAEAKTSLECLKDRTCLPLGAENVVAAFPAVSAEPASLPLVLVLAPLDTDALFHLSLHGAEHQYSALIVMATAARLLQAQWAAYFGAGGVQGRLQRRLVFAALAGEPFGLMGSRRLMYEMHHAGTDITTLPSQLAAPLIDLALDLGPLGRPKTLTNGQKTYFIHRPSTPGSRWPIAFASDPERQVTITTANKTGANPGLPPGAAFSVASYSPTIEIATLADFDAALPDGLMWALEDAQGQLDTESMAQVALELARALFIVTAGTGAGPSFSRDVTQARASVQALVGCLTADVPGLVCDLAFEYMYPVGALPKRYVSTYNYPTEDPDTPNYRSDVARLMYNLLGEAVKTPGQNRTAAVRCSPYTDKCNQTGMACLSWKSQDNLGYCLESFVQFRPSISPALYCDGCPHATTFAFNASLAPAGGLDFAGSDQVYAESYWPVELAVSFYQREQDTKGTLAAGILTLAAWAGIYYFGRSYWSL